MTEEGFRMRCQSGPGRMGTRWPAFRAEVCSSLLWLGLIGGCATTGWPEPIRPGETVAIVVVNEPRTGDEVGIRNQALRDGASAGAGSGMLVGGLSGLSCGPVAVLCVPLGLMLGGVTGTAAGALVGATGTLPQDKAEQVRARLGQVWISHDLRAELERNINQRARPQWSLDSDQPTKRVTVTLKDIELSSTRDERIGFTVRVVVAMMPPADARRPAMTERRYEYVVQSTTLADWLDERSEFIDSGLSLASRQIALQIVADLTAH